MKTLWKFKVKIKDNIDWYFWHHKPYVIITYILDIILPMDNYIEPRYNRRITTLRIHTHMVK